MIDGNDDSSFSDNDNIKEALIEATDQEFSQNSLFSNDKSKPKLNGSVIGSTGSNVKLSSRLNSERIGNCNIFCVSQSYKEFVAKKLYRLLKRNIELTEIIDAKKIKKKQRLKGIRLLSSSSDVLTCHDEIVPIGAFPNNKKTVYHDSAVDMWKCQEVAVNPELIIAKTETELWNERQRGMMFKYKKMSDGTLIEQTYSSMN